MSHLQPTITSGSIHSVSVTDDVVESMTTSPLASVSSGIALHYMRFGEVVPGPEQMDRLYRRMGLTARKSALVQKRNFRRRCQLERHGHQLTTATQRTQEQREMADQGWEIHKI